MEGYEFSTKVSHASLICIVVPSGANTMRQHTNKWIQHFILIFLFCLLFFVCEHFSVALSHIIIDFREMHNNLNVECMLASHFSPFSGKENPSTQWSPEKRANCISLNRSGDLEEISFSALPFGGSEQMIPVFLIRFGLIAFRFENVNPSDYYQFEVERQKMIYPIPERRAAFQWLPRLQNLSTCSTFPFAESSQLPSRRTFGAFVYTSTLSAGATGNERKKIKMYLL